MSVRNLKFHYITDGDKCDKKAETAVIEDLVGNISYICKECLEEMIKAFDEEEE
mgnify:CR=1 FL=1